LGSDEYRDVRAELAQCDLGPVALDQSGFLELSKPLPARRWRKADPLRQRRLGNAPLGGEHPQDGNVACIELHLRDYAWIIVPAAGKRARTWVAMAVSWAPVPVRSQMVTSSGDFRPVFVPTITSPSSAGRPF